MESAICFAENYFKFPFKPYKIQEEFMQNLYLTIENGKIGIFESPTGTGKSLSIICGALTWLKDHEKKKEEEVKRILSGESSLATNDTEASNEPDWVEEFFQVKAAKELSNKIKKNESGKKARKEKLGAIRREKQLKRKRQEQLKDRNNVYGEKFEEALEECNEDQDEELVMEEYFSDSDRAKPVESESYDEEEEIESEEDQGIKIFYCSRTHSQLSQFIHEIKMSPFGEDIKVAALGSRQTYCINEEVKKLQHTSRINERCLDLQKKKSEKQKKDDDTDQPKKRRKQKGKSGCPYYGYKKFDEFKGHLLDNVQDIEQLASLGKDLETCPYYGSRHSIPEAQLVVLPYQTLLHKPTREAVGINLKGNIVIVDEAHNLIETINNIHSVQITLPQITTSFSQLTQYRDRYRNRLKAKNLMYIEQILFVLKSLVDTLLDQKIEQNEDQGSEQETSYMMTINNFLCASNIDNVNLFKIRRYCESSLIARKLNGFVEKYNGVVKNNTTEDDSTPTSMSQFFSVESLLDSLTNFNKDGRILITKSKISSKVRLKFLLLNPSVYFTELIDKCKAIVFAGGTMEPVSEFKDILLHSSGVINDRILQFTAGHVIPPSNLVVISIGKGPSSVNLNFTFQDRSRSDMIEELGRVLCNVCAVVPGGVVCFFPSYEYEEKVFTKLWSNGILQKIEKRKKVFREPKKSGSMEKTLLEYSNHIKHSKSIAVGSSSGSLLFSVVGGKMSEGINFSDDLGRCIIMVGLPYPNKTSPELKEKMDFLNQQLGPNAGNEHYENICMKAVNQSIGRAIRHKDDYACILMLDQRYSKPSVHKKLPSWIRSKLVVHTRFGPCVGQISKFFIGKRNLPS